MMLASCLVMLQSDQRSMKDHTQPLELLVVLQDLIRQGFSNATMKPVRNDGPCEVPEAACDVSC